MNNFTLIDIIGEGAYSKVYKALRISDSKLYALKKVEILKLTEKEKHNALNEIRILASIDNDYIIKYKESFFDVDHACLSIVMEYADYGDLLQLIKDARNKGYFFSEEFIRKVIICLIEGVDTLHNNYIFHRDLKSANVFLFSNGKAKLGDLNVSKVAHRGLGSTQTGTPYYASPEIWKDSPYDYKSDIWSLGCIIHEVCSLNPPFKAESMDELYNKVIKGKYELIPSHYSWEIRELIKILLNTKPEKRPSCKEIKSSQLYKNLNKGIIFESDDTEYLKSTINYNNKTIYNNEFITSNTKDRNSDCSSSMTENNNEKLEKSQKNIIFKTSLEPLSINQNNENQNNIENNEYLDENIDFYDTIKIPFEINLNNFYKLSKYLPKNRYNQKNKSLNENETVNKLRYSDKNNKDNSYTILNENQLKNKKFNYKNFKKEINNINIRSLQKNEPSSKNSNFIIEKFNKLTSIAKAYKLEKINKFQMDNDYMKCAMFNNIVMNFRSQEIKNSELENYYKQVCPEVFNNDPLEKLRRIAKPYLYLPKINNNKIVKKENKGVVNKSNKYVKVMENKNLRDINNKYISLYRNNK